MLKFSVPFPTALLSWKHEEEDHVTNILFSRAAPVRRPDVGTGDWRAQR